MISVAEATGIIHKSIQALQPVKVQLQNAVGLKLVTDVFAIVDIPSFPQSSMDGYAFSFNDWQLHKDLIVDGEIAAGSSSPVEVKPGSALRIFTGAAVPAGADTVVMQEKVRIENGRLIIEDEKLQQGNNVRPKGSEITAGTLALSAGTMLTPAALGFLAGIGIAEVTVYPRPSVTIIVTGNELQQPGIELQHGQVYESNSVALKTALQSMGINNAVVEKVQDDADAVTQILQQSLERSDVVLLTGGVSVGDYDFVLQAANRCSVVSMFHKIKQRPGKPLYFGKIQDKVIFGLPGNPSSVLTCFYMYVVPALGQLNKTETRLRIVQAPLAKAYNKAGGLTHFLKGYYDGKTATLLGAQESYRMQSFAHSNCLIQIDEETIRCEEGSIVQVHLLPYNFS